MPKRRLLFQRSRLFAGALYVAALYAVALWRDRTPDLSASGAWFWAGALLIVLATTLAEPLEPTPGEAVGNAAALILAAIAFPSEESRGIPTPTDTLAAGRWLVAGFASVPLASGLLVIIAKRQPPVRHVEKGWERLLRRMTVLLGSARVTYSVGYIAASLAVMHRDVADLVILWIAWFVIVVARPLEWIHEHVFVQRARIDRTIASVVALRDPALVEIVGSLPGAQVGSEIKLGDATLVIVDKSRLSDAEWFLAALRTGDLPEVGDEASLTGQRAGDVLGFVEPGTDMNSVACGVTTNLSGLDYGDLLAAPIEGADVLFQVISAELRDSRLDPDVAHTRALVRAAKLGTWNPKLRRFSTAAWLPQPGAIVRRLPRLAEPITAESIGHVPGTDFDIRLETDSLVTQGAAVLGVLGSGKSTFAKELVRRVAATGCHILILDSTPEYFEDLADLTSRSPDAFAGKVNAAIGAKAAYVDAAPRLGGNRREFADAIRQDLLDFISKDELVRVYDLTKFDVTKQVTGQNFRTEGAGIDDCTLPEIAAIIAEETLAIVRSERRESAHLWVVLEEGHHLVPEFTSISAKDDEKAVARTAKVFLQGRKFGLGVLVVTQRTANVSKSLLTQGNTTFCFRTHDDTTANFLRERAGSDHVAALPRLEDRRMLAMGRALSCEDPLFVRVNDEAAIRELLMAADEVKADEVVAGSEDGDSAGLNPEAEKQSDSASQGTADANSRWQLLLGEVGRRSRRLGAMLHGSRLLSVADTNLLVEVQAEFHRKELSKPDNYAAVRIAAESVFGVGTAIEFVSREQNDE